MCTVHLLVMYIVVQFILLVHLFMYGLLFIIFPLHVRFFVNSQETISNSSSSFAQTSFPVTMASRACGPNEKLSISSNYKWALTMRNKGENLPFHINLSKSTPLYFLFPSPKLEFVLNPRRTRQKPRQQLKTTSRYWRYPPITVWMKPIEFERIPNCSMATNTGCRN